MGESFFKTDVVQQFQIKLASLILNEKKIATGGKSGCNYDFPNRCIPPQAGRTVV
jgi:hypothetical protein